MGAPADTGLRLLQHICTRTGIGDLSGLDMLDFGCGCRFAEAIINHNVPLKCYVGIDVYKEMIDYLVQHVTDPRLEFFHIDARNPWYNPNGLSLSTNTAFPIGDRKFDIVCMYSVITHQVPADASVIFKLMRRHVKLNGFLFFSAATENGGFGYREQFPETPTVLSVYTMASITELLHDAGWRIVSFEQRVPNGLPNQETFLCTPV
jgi:SAM-dependent methyltransferase